MAGIYQVFSAVNHESILDNQLNIRFIECGVKKMAKEDGIICTNVFKNQDETSIRIEFTRIWIDLMNYLESCKSNS